MRKILLCRINIFRIFFKNDRCINDFFSVLKLIMIKYSHNFKKTVFHQNMKNKLTNKFIVFNTKNEMKNKIKYFLSIHRKLQLLIMFLNLLTFDNHFDLKIDTIKSLFKEKKFYLS